MSYKTILVYLNDEQQAEQVIKAAVAIAQKNSAHLIGLHVASVPQYYSTVAVDLTAEIVEIQNSALKQESKKMKAIFEKFTATEDILTEWRSLQAHSALVADTIVNHGRCVDLVVAGQADPDRSDIGVGRVLERFLIDSGRPVLIIPYAGSHAVIGENITIAWNASRESARAVAAALPLLKAAKKVSVLWVNPDDESGENIDVPGAEIATCLSRHGVHSETDHSTTRQPEVGGELLSRVADEGADLLVMGAYGHSRMREFIFGGASRHILQQMTVPVLMVH